MFLLQGTAGSLGKIVMGELMAHFVSQTLNTEGEGVGYRTSGKERRMIAFFAVAAVGGIIGNSCFGLSGVALCLAPFVVVLLAWRISPDSVRGYFCGKPSRRYG